MEQEMKSPSELPVEVTRNILVSIQSLLWLDTNAQGPFWSTEKEWHWEMLDEIASLLEDHGLRPDDPDEPDAMWNASLGGPSRGAGAGREDNGAIKPDFVQRGK
jgi:hypothetical protein